MIKQITILAAILSLKPEYSSSPIIVSSSDENIDSSETTVDWGGATPISNSDITTEQTRLQTEYDNNAYQRNRAAEYPSIADQLDEIYHNGIDSWKAVIKTTKDKYPKP